jgi:hypothetical protein
MFTTPHLLGFVLKQDTRRLISTVNFPKTRLVWAVFKYSVHTSKKIHRYQEHF